MGQIDYGQRIKDIDTDQVIESGQHTGRNAMSTISRFTVEERPDLPHARQLKMGFPWLAFDAELESEFRHSSRAEQLRYIRINLCFAIIITLAFTALDAVVLRRETYRITSLIPTLIIIPILLLSLAASFTRGLHRLYPPLAPVAATAIGLAVVAIQFMASLDGVSMLFSSLELTTIFIYFMAGLVFSHSLTANAILALAYLASGFALPLSSSGFGYNVLSIFMFNVFCASVVYSQEKRTRRDFLETALLRDMVARDGLTGIQNRRMFDHHIQLWWQQAVRDSERIAVALVDIDCFKDYNDRYGHQAGDECLRAVARSLSHCARRPLDFIARFGGEEFVIVLYAATREYLAELLTRLQRSIAELNIPHEASLVANRLTVSVGVAIVLPRSNRAYQGLIQLADEALYSAKEQGRNRVVVREAEYQTLQTGRFEKRRGQRAP